MGMAKQINTNDLIVNRYNKTYTAIKLKDNDELISANYSLANTLIVTKNGYYLKYNTNEIPVIGVKASGVKSIKLDNDEVVSGISYSDDEEYLNIFTNNLTSKRVKLMELKTLSRAKKGTILIKRNKTVNYYITYAYIVNSRDTIIMKKDNEITEIKVADIPIMDLLSNGSNITKGYVDEFKIKNEPVKIINKEEVKVEEKEDVKEEQISFEDFTEDFKL